MMTLAPPHKPVKNLTTITVILIALAISTVACAAPKNTILEDSSLNELFTQLVNSHSQTQRTLKLNNNLQFTVTLEGTSKGNGTLKVHNLYLRIFDQHDDGLVYEGDSLNIDFKDLNNDKLNEIIITGTLKYTGNNETDPVSYKPFTQVFSFNCKTGLFITLYKASNYSIELPAKNVNPAVCIY